MLWIVRGQARPPVNETARGQGHAAGEACVQRMLGRWMETQRSTTVAQLNLADGQQ